MDNIKHKGIIIVSVSAWADCKVVYGYKREGLPKGRINCGKG